MKKGKQSRTTLLDGTWTVWGPGFDVSLLSSRLWANMARSITESLPLREPYELNSLGTTLHYNNNNNIDHRVTAWSHKLNSN